MSFDGARRPSQLRSVIAMAVAVWVLVMVAHCDLLRSESHAPHPAHPVLTSLGAQFAVNVDHAHLVDGSSTACHEVFATAVLPRSGTALAVLGAVVAVGAVMGSLAQLVVSPGRGPPRGLAAFLTGQDLLTRFCLAHR